MRFKTFILEKPMNFSTYNEVLKRLDKDAKMGFELEVIVPKDFLPDRKTKGQVAKTLEVRSIDTLDEIAEYFDAHRNLIYDIQREFDSWSRNKMQEWVDDNWEKYDADEPDESDEHAAREAAENDYDYDYRFEDFVEDEYGGIGRLIRYHGLEPRYGWANDSYQSIVDWEFYAEEFEPVNIEPVLRAEVLDQLRIAKIAEDGWRVVADGSIEPGGDEIGAEIITPPLRPSIAISKLRACFEFMRAENFRTNSSTGLHINISIPELSEKIDPVKLILFMGDEYALNLFNRLGNTYTKSQMRSLYSSLQDVRDSLASNNQKFKPSVNELHAMLLDALVRTKYQSVNLLKLGSGYLEFRSAGGYDYEKRFDEVIRTALRFLTAIDIACDPKEQRNEYLKKLTKLLDKVLGDHAKDVLMAKQIEKDKKYKSK